LKKSTEGGKSEVSEGQGDQGGERVRPGVYDVHEDRTSEADAEIRSQSGTAARTRKLSSSAPMVVGGPPPARVGCCRAKIKSSEKLLFLF
jgi:hypothetical protein